MPGRPRLGVGIESAGAALRRSLRAAVTAVGFAAASAAQSQVVPVLPPLIGDPTGRSSEPPPLFDEQPGRAREPVPIVPSSPPAPVGPSVLPGIAVAIHEIRVVGSTVFSPEQTAAVTDPYLRKGQLTSEDLEALRVALTRLYIDRGYVNSGAVLPDQTVTGGVITYQIIEGKLTRTEIEGNRWLRASYYKDRLALGSAPPLNVEALQGQIQLLLEDQRIERINADLKPGTNPAEAVLDVRVEERFPLRLYLDFDNYQSPSVGAERGVATIEHQSLTGNGDVLSLSYGRSQGLDPLLDFGYAVPITAHDTTLGVRYRRNDLTVVQDPFRALDIQSDSEVYTVTLRQPVYRTPSTLVALELTGERSSLDTSVLGIPFSLEPGAVDGHSVATAVRFAQEVVYRTRTQVIAARSRFSFGVDALGSTIHGDDKPDSQFLAWLGQFQYVRQLGPLEQIGIPDTQIILRSDMQVTNKPLLTVEQIAVGGRYSVRGYPQNTLVRDNAFIASAELRIPIVRNKRWADYLELAPFFDYGRAWNTDRQTGEPPDLAGIGVGLRWALTVPSRALARPQFEIYWGHPLRKIQTSATPVQGNGLYFQFLVSVF